MNKRILVLIVLMMGARVESARAQSLSTITCPGNGCATIGVSGKGSIGIQITGT